LTSSAGRRIDDIDHVVPRRRAQLLDIAPLGVVPRVADKCRDVMAGRGETRDHRTAHPPGADEPDVHRG
jgi:hypothetical protein